jgi:CheY-like chemotaxis protein
MRKPARPLTIMLVDSGGQRQLLGMLGARGHRVVPVAFEEAVELAQRLRFDAVLLATRPGGPNWSELQERVRTHVPSFVLINDGNDPELAQSLEKSEGHLLVRPIQESDLARVLKTIEELSHPLQYL